MAGRLSFQIGVDGAAKAAIDFQKLNDVLKSLNQTVQSLGGVSGKINLGKIDANTQYIIDKLSPKAQLQFYKDAAKGQKQMEQGVSASTIQISKWREQALRRDTNVALREFKKMGDIAGQGGINWRMAAMGVAAAPFSPWIAARSLSSSGIFNSLAGAGGAASGGGLFGKLVGPGGFAGFTAAFLAVNAAVKATKMAFEEMTEAVKRGSQLYLKAAELGTSIDTFSHLSKTLTALGMSPNTAEKLMASGQFMRGQRMTAQDVMIGAGRGVLSREEMQGIFNLSKDIASLWNDTLDAARQSAKSSRPLFELNMQMEKLRIEWQTLWEQMMAAFAPFVAEALKGATYVLQIANALAELGNAVQLSMKMIVDAFTAAFPQLAATLKLAGILGDITIAAARSTGAAPTGGFSKFGGIGTPAAFNSWQRMGFVLNNGGGVTDYAKQTAKNTEKLVRIMEKSVTVQETTPDYDKRFNMP